MRYVLFLVGLWVGRICRPIADGWLSSFSGKRIPLRPIAIPFGYAWRRARFDARLRKLLKLSGDEFLAATSGKKWRDLWASEPKQHFWFDR